MQAMPTPPVTPLQPAIPPPQTSQGTLHESGLSITTDYKMAGDCVMPDDGGRWEIVDFYELSTPTTVLRLNIRGPNWTDSGHLMPARNYGMLSSNFHDVALDFSLYAIKPPDTTGKILLEEIPDARYPLTDVDTSESVFNNAGFNRAAKHFWDVGESPIYTGTFIPPSYLAHRPTRDRFNSNSEAWFTSYILMSWATPYMHGAIYPSTFTILLFTRWNIRYYMPMLPHIFDMEDWTWRDVAEPEGKRAADIKLPKSIMMRLKNTTL